MRRDALLTDEDGEWISRVRGGDLAAFEALYDKYKGQIYRTALAITRDQDSAEDILQECFVRVYTHIDKVDVARPFSPWVHRIAVNLSYNWLTKRRRWLPSLEEVMELLTGDRHTSPEQILEREELQSTIQRALYSLGFAQRVVVVLFYLNGFSLEEIAYILDCPVGTVKSRLYYARENLRRKLGVSKRLPAGVVP